MDDNLDRANDENGASLSEALRRRKPEGPVATGHCNWCELSVSPDLRWCNVTCRDQWTLYQTLQGRQ